MGGTDFMTSAKGRTVDDAFKAAVKQAQYDYGHAGYTGTIAEKDSWVIVHEGQLDITEARKLVDKLMDADDERINDKWGPAGAIQLTDDDWLFFGWASL